MENPTMECVYIDLEHVDVSPLIPDENRAASKPGATYITFPPGIRYLPARVAHEEPDDRISYRLEPGPHGQEEVLYGDGARGTIQAAYGPEAIEELTRRRWIASVITLPADSEAVLSSLPPSAPRPDPIPPRKEYVESDLKILKLLRMHKRVYDHAISRTHLDNVFWQVNAIIRNNKLLNEDGGFVFVDFIFECYAHAVSVGLRAMVDKDSRSDSLARLLDSMEMNAHLFTRERHRSMMSSLPAWLADEGFDKIAGPGQPAVPATVFRAWRSELESEVRIIQKFLNKHVTHLDSNPSVPIPTVHHIRRGLVVVREALKNCESVLTGSSLMTSVPVIQGNWLKVFRIPWLPTGQPVPKYTHLDDLPYPLPAEPPP